MRRISWLGIDNLQTDSLVDSLIGWFHRQLKKKLVADPGADALDAVLAALGAACSVCREDFPAPEDGEMCLSRC